MLIKLVKIHEQAVLQQYQAIKKLKHPKIVGKTYLCQILQVRQMKI